MKLRKIGNSLGTTFSREVLTRAGFEEGQELDVLASPGKIEIVPMAPQSVTILLTNAEADALATGNLKSPPGEAALEKVRRMISAR